MSSKYAGKGYSKLIIDWVKALGESMGKDYIRIDFNEEREYLRKLYYGNGFECIKRYKDESGKKIALAEYKIRRDS